MQRLLKKQRFFTMLAVIGIMASILSYSNLSSAQLFRGGNTHASDKITTFTAIASAEGGALNTVKIEKVGDGLLTLDKAYLFVGNGLNAGNMHLHNVVVDGVVIAHFGMSEVKYLEAPASEDEPKFRGGEVTHLLKQLMNIDEMKIIANQTIEFDFMATGDNDPSPTQVSLMIHVRSPEDAEVNITVSQ